MVAFSNIKKSDSLSITLTVFPKNSSNEQFCLYFLNMFGIINVAFNIFPRTVSFKYYMALNPKDNTIILSDPNTLKVYKIDPGNLEDPLSVLACNGEKAPSWDDGAGDEGLATEASCNMPKG